MHERENKRAINYYHLCDYVMFAVLFTLGKKATTHQVPTLLATSKMTYFQALINLVATGADDPSLHLSLALGYHT